MGWPHTGAGAGCQLGWSEAAQGAEQAWAWLVHKFGDFQAKIGDLSMSIWLCDCQSALSHCVMIHDEFCGCQTVAQPQGEEFKFLSLERTWRKKRAEVLQAWKQSGQGLETFFDSMMAANVIGGRNLGGRIDSSTTSSKQSSNANQVFGGQMRPVTGSSPLTLTGQSTVPYHHLPVAPIPSYNNGHVTAGKHDKENERWDYFYHGLGKYIVF